ncbi:hypothetical protein [Pseudofrankia inefficax]|uniref:hypothetical protein n=1 Tax=Pseudofrankia inefficax (strain DSM 45817 / CECT 9037 / DDB 130130 / EuI1c) TaxID=298654 RepID=UPI0012FD305E|nr:hypothetical protein [Pseudofrankia inefficax]
MRPTTAAARAVIDDEVRGIRNQVAQATSGPVRLSDAEDQVVGIRCLRLWSEHGWTPWPEHGEMPPVEGCDGLCAKPLGGWPDCDQQHRENGYSEQVRLKTVLTALGPVQIDIPGIGTAVPSRGSRG